MNATFRTLFGTLTLAALALVAVPGTANAQGTGFGDAGAKIRGDAY